MPDFTANPGLLIILAIVNIPTYYFMGTLFYKNWHDFTEGLRSCFITRNKVF